MHLSPPGEERTTAHTAAFGTAATATATFQVTANVQTQCTVSAVDLGFGTVDPLGANVDH